MTLNHQGIRIFVRGLVQGVGFRPYVYAKAKTYLLTGWVKNTSNGVEIELCGPRDALDNFIDDLSSDLPPLARVDTMQIEEVPPGNYSSFDILFSTAQPGDFIPVSADMSICPDCQKELFSPSDRRYRYPFINCTNCGPRFTIIRDIPYDRPKTTMADFPMCPDCSKEYHDPADRRFHAQPIACPTCGPMLYFESKTDQTEKGEVALQTAREWLKNGKILAIKGLGGFHLACDASNIDAVRVLRLRKQRVDKPFALMAFDLNTIYRHAKISSSEVDLLRSPQHPIVLLDRHQTSKISDETSPGQNTVGFMLPYTPLHLLLMEPEDGFPDVLVMTSGNLCEEPIAYQDKDARLRLKHLADGILFHNRPIHMRVDDSVVRDINSKVYFLRRSRGYAPDPIITPANLPQSLATGGELKNTFCLTRDNYAFMSHYIGDLDNFETLGSFENGIDHFEKLFRIKPEYISCDMHPDYLSSRYAKARAIRDSLPLINIQHHHAHLAACLADNDWTSSERVIGLIFDGTGFGTDQAIWGGELLSGNYSGFSRECHLSYVPMPGGDISVKNPCRIALSHLLSAGIPWDGDLAPVFTVSEEERRVISSQISHRINSPFTSSMGRLFDAASSIMGIRQNVNYEGQAAIEMENLIDHEDNGYYEFNVDREIIDPAPLWRSLIKDLRSGVPSSSLSSRFHNSIVELSLSLCRQLRHDKGLDHVALAGGVWQNKYLLTNTRKRLQEVGFKVMIHHRLPANDGSLALGQAMIAACSFSK